MTRKGGTLNDTLSANFTLTPAQTSAAPEPFSVAAFAFTGLGAARLILRARKRRTLA